MPKAKKKIHKKLEKTFAKSGFTYKEIEREEEFRVYSQSKDGRVLAYVVARIRTVPAPEAWNAPYDTYEAFPGPSTWGLYAWTLKTEEDALAKLEDVLDWG